MRFLCLHGSGASSKILESQLGLIMTLLPSTWTYDFLDAPLSSPPAPELRLVYPPPYFCFFTAVSDASINAAVDLVREVIEEDGPYDAVIGFSQGASVLAAYMASHSQAGLSSPIKLAIFFCAALLPPAVSRGDELASLVQSFGTIDVPSVHIIGKQDTCARQGKQLAEACNRGSEEAKIIWHGGGHEIPRDERSCKDIASAISGVARAAFLGK